MNEDSKPITRALALGLNHGGLQVAFNYPGFFSHELFSLVGGTVISLSEKHAYAEAFGSSMANHRTMVTFKNVGLNVAADEYLHSVISGVGAGLVLVIFDDIDVWGSQESQDSRHFLDFYGGLLLEPTSLQDAYDVAYSSFELSETHNVPVIIRITNAHLALPASFVTHRRNLTYARADKPSPEQVIVHPYYWAAQANALRAKNQTLQEINSLLLESPNSSDSLTIIFGGTIHSEQDGDVLTINSLPLTNDFIEAISSSNYKEIRIIEYGQPYVCEKILALGLAASIYSVVPDILANPKEFTAWDRDKDLFSALARIKNEHDLYVFGDITRFTVEDQHVIDASLCYGSAVSNGIGYARSKSSLGVVSIVGDGSIIHEGLEILIYAASLNVRLTVIIVDNGGLWCTGGQAAPINVEQYLRNNNLLTTIIDTEKQSIDEMYDALNDAVIADGLAVILVKAPMGSFRDE